MALANLAASYSDSDSEDEKETEAQHPLVEDVIKNDTKTDYDNISDSEGELTNDGAGYFGNQFDDSGTSSSQNSEDEDNPGRKGADTTSSSKRLPNPLATTRLPSAMSTLTSSSVEGSVFGNKFAQEEKAKIALYEKHVKMTEDKITSQPHCFKFRKGACRKGDKCRFRHDLGLQVPGYTPQIDPIDIYNAATVQQPPGPSFPEQGKSKRPGVTNTLYPAKKAKSSLQEQREKERPWTVQK